QRPIQARPISPAAGVRRGCQRQPAVASLAAALVAVVLASLIGLTFLWLRAEELGTVAQEKRHEAEANLDEVRRQQQRAQDSYQLARASLEECVKKVTDDPRLKSGPLEDLRQLVLQAEALFYQKFVDLQGTEPDFQAERGLAFRRLAKLTADLGAPDKAFEHGRQA